MSVMFANARASQSNSGYLVEFKAGRSVLQPGSTPNKRKVVADKTKGLVFIKQSNDQLMHFCWKNRESGAISDDLIIFPGDTEFIRIKECTDGRLYMLKFKSTDERRLFWMQEGDTGKDDEYCKKVNEVLNNPPAPRQAGRSGAERNVGSALGGALAAFNAAGTDADLSALSNLDQGQLMQLLSLMNNPNAASSSEVPPLSMVRTTPVPETESTSTQVATPSNTPANGTVSDSGGQPSAAQVQLSQLQDIIASIGARAKQTRIELSDVLNNDNVGETVSSNEERLVSHVPNQGPIFTPQEELEQTVRTPQFRQAVDMFGHAFQTGQMAPVLQQFGMSPEVTTAAQSGDLVSFAQKLTEAEGGDSGEGSAEASDQPALRNLETDAEIAREAASEETNESFVKEPEPKRGKPDGDNMDLD